MYFAILPSCVIAIKDISSGLGISTHDYALWSDEDLKKENHTCALTISSIAGGDDKELFK